MKPWVGVLLNRGILQKGVRGRPVFEKLHLYAQAAAELGVRVVFFEPGGIRLKKQEVIGFIPTASGGFRRSAVPLPRAVHKRGIFRSPASIKKIKGLQKLGICVFNPQISADKYQFYQLLNQNHNLRPYLPETRLIRRENFQWFQHKLAQGAEIFVKPKMGSLGLGIARVFQDRPGRYWYQSLKRRRLVTLKGAWRMARKGGARRLVQEGIPLLTDQGRRVDFRVPVQKGGDNRWHIAGIAAKRAEKTAFLTNLARGGSVHPGPELLARHFGTSKATRIVDEISHVAVLVAKTLHGRYPQLVDLGLDIGVDTQGHPYVIEVNRRDLRVLLQRSGQPRAFEALYKNPIAYARYVLEHGIRNAS